MNKNLLFKAIYELYELLFINKVNEENQYQKYLENNPIVFEALDYDVVESFEKSSGNKLPKNEELNFRPEPDFIARKQLNGQIEIFEIKTPFVGEIITTKNGQRTKFTAKTEEYFSQVSEYIDSIDRCSDIRKKIAEIMKVEECKTDRKSVV